MKILFASLFYALNFHYLRYPCTILTYLLYFDKAVCKLCFSIIYLRNFSEFSYYLVLNGLTSSLVKFVKNHVSRVSSEEQ